MTRNLSGFKVMSKDPLWVRANGDDIKCGGDEVLVTNVINGGGGGGGTHED
jgi:hypothetical protein